MAPSTVSARTSVQVRAMAGKAKPAAKKAAPAPKKTGSKAEKYLGDSLSKWYGECRPKCGGGGGVGRGGGGGRT